MQLNIYNMMAAQKETVLEEGGSTFVVPRMVGGERRQEASRTKS
jgi:hypothetical protein